jgi:hypothetical protein
VQNNVIYVTSLSSKFVLVCRLSSRCWRFHSDPAWVPEMHFSGLCGAPTCKVYSVLGHLGNRKWGQWFKLSVSHYALTQRIVQKGRIKSNVFILFDCFRRNNPQRAMTSKLLRFLDHTQRRITVGRTPVDEWSARRRDLYLTTQQTYPCPWRDSNPQSQQANRRRPTP